MSWDLTAVLVAVKGYEPYYNVERGTFRVVNDEGANSWTPDGKGRDLLLDRESAGGRNGCSD